MTIVQVYVPTKEKYDGMIEEFYTKLEEAMELTKKCEITIMMGDFNAKVGAGTVENVIGNFVLGGSLNTLCTEQQLFVVKTFFKLHPHRLYTWISPTDCKEHRV